MMKGGIPVAHYFRVSEGFVEWNGIFCVGCSEEEAGCFDGSSAIR